MATKKPLVASKFATPPFLPDDAAAEAGLPPDIDSPDQTQAAPTTMARSLQPANGAAFNGAPPPPPPTMVPQDQPPPLSAPGDDSAAPLQFFGQQPQAPPPQQTAPPAATLPPPPQMQKPSLARQIIGGAVGLLAPGIGREIANPGYSRALQNYTLQTKATQEQAQLNELQARAQEEQARGIFYENQRNRFKIDPKTGLLYDTGTGAIVQPPKGLSDRIADYTSAGYSPEDARYLAAGGKPVAPGTATKGTTPITAELASSPLGQKLGLKEGDALPSTVYSGLVRAITTEAKTPQLQFEHFVNGTNGDVTTIGFDRSTGEEKSRSVIKGVAPGRPPVTVNLSPDARDMAAQQYLSTGQLPSLGFGNSGATARSTIMNRAAEIGTGQDLASNKANFQANSGSLRNLQKNRDQVMAFEHTASANLDLANNLSQQVGRTGSPLLNEWVLAAKGKIAGDANTRKFQAAVQTAANEYAKVVTNNGASGSVTDSARKEYEKVLNAADNPQTFQAIVGLMKQEMANRRAGFDSQLSEMRGRMTGGNPGGAGAGGGKHLTDPATAQQYLQRAGGDKNKARQLAAADGWTF